MKSSALLIALLSLTGLARAESSVEATVTGFPAETTELLFFLDVVGPPEGSGYDEPAAAADPAAPQPQRRRRGPAKPAFTARGAIKPNGSAPVTWSTPAPAGANYRVRVAAIKGEGTFPVVVAGGKATGLRVDADKKTSSSIALTAPSLKLAAENPTTVKAGAPFKLAGVVNDPGSFLGTKNRMRVWMNSGQAPVANQAGTQVSTVDVTTKDDEVSFSIDLTAPREAGPLYVQFGEVSPDFSRPDGKQVPFIVLPDLTAGGKPVELRVEAAKVAETSGR